jgi:hypothetical protein
VRRSAAWSSQGAPTASRPPARRRHGDRDPDRGPTGASTANSAVEPPPHWVPVVDTPPPYAPRKPRSTARRITRTAAPRRVPHTAHGETSADRPRPPAVGRPAAGTPVTRMIPSTPDRERWTTQREDLSRKRTSSTQLLIARTVAALEPLRNGTTGRAPSLKWARGESARPGRKLAAIVSLARRDRPRSSPEVVPSEGR